MGLLVAIAVAAGLGLTLGLLWKLYLELMSSLVWGCILLTGFWVAGNVLLILRLQAAGEHSTILRWVHRGWSAFFFYSSLLQGVVFLTLTFWALSLIFRSEVSPPESMQEFVLDFVKGSSALAAVVFLGTGGSALMGEPSAGIKLLATVYLLLVGAGAILPWIYAAQLSAWVDVAPGTAFWSTIGIYALLSAAGMALYAASMEMSPRTVL